MRFRNGDIVRIQCFENNVKKYIYIFYIHIYNCVNHGTNFANFLDRAEERVKERAGNQSSTEFPTIGSR